MEDLPSSFDVIVIGTGMPECILAAAAARSGKSVLHLDKNNYYGGNWASFNFDQFVNWLNKQKETSTDVQENSISESWQELLLEGEQLVLANINPKTISNVTDLTFIRENPVEEESSQKEEGETHVNVGGESSSASENIPVETYSAAESSEGVSNAQSSEGNGTTSEEIQNNTETECVGTPAPVDSSSITENNSEISSPAEQSNDSPRNNQVTEAPSESSNSVHSCITDSKKEWTMADLRHQYRKFNLDLAPKLLFARGPLVELLISSNIARYAEFKCFTRVLTLIDQHLEQVPCSRADVFSTRTVSVVEKRMLMKLLTFCLEYQKHPEEYRGFEGRPFIEFLRSKKLTSSVEHYVLYAIAMVDETTPTLQGLQSTQKFLESLGRYGNSPFLWTLYGSAELPQCFCRLCAVFGGIYYLNRTAEAVILNAEGACTGIISSGQRFSCSWLVMESSFSPTNFFPEQEPERLSRGIFITDSSILPVEREQLTLLRLPPKDTLKVPVTVFELGPAAYICPDGLYIVHMICPSVEETAKDDIIPAANILFQPIEQDLAMGESCSTKPKILWCAFYNQRDTSSMNLNSNTPQGIVLLPSPGVEQDYYVSVNEAQQMFQKMYPGEEFLPRAPEPEEIVYEHEGNPAEANNENAQENGILSLDNENEQKDLNEEEESIKETADNKPLDEVEQ